MGAEVNGQLVRVSDEDPAIQCRLSPRRAGQRTVPAEEIDSAISFNRNTPKDLVKRRSSKLWS